MYERKPAIILRDTIDRKIQAFCTNSREPTMQITVFVVSDISCFQQPNSLLLKVSYPNFFSCTIAANVPGVADVFAGATAEAKMCRRPKRGTPREAITPC